MNSIVRELADIVGSLNVIHGAALADRPCGYWDASALCAKALVTPTNAGEVSRVLALCNERGQSVVMRGGATGVSGGAEATPNDIVLTLEKMAEIEEIDHVGRTMTVQGGCVLQNVQAAARERGLYLPLDLGARGSCTIGGNVATNAGGLNVLRFGMIREQILGLEAVLADGTVISSMNRMLKNNAGFDLKHLFIGSEGTLGVVTRVILRLRKHPASDNSALIAIDDFQKATMFLRDVDKSLGGTLSAFEVMWGSYFRAVTEPGWHASPLGRTHPFYVVLEALGEDPARDEERFQATLNAALDCGLIVDAVLPKSRAERDHFWAIREDFQAILSDRPQFPYDVSLPIADMDEYVTSLQANLTARWPTAQMYVFGHIADGNLHLFISPHEDSTNAHGEINRLVYEPLRRFGGSISAEHGIGLEKVEYLSVSRTAEEIALMQTLKCALDPKGILNPGKVLPDRSRI